MARTHCRLLFVLFLALIGASGTTCYGQDPVELRATAPSRTINDRTLTLKADLLDGGGSSCLDSEITLQSSALERLVEDPESVLAQEARFWEDEPAQRFTDAWAESNGFTISRSKWRQRVRPFVELDARARQDSDLNRTARRLIDGQAEFIPVALEHVCLFLPEDVDTDVTLYLTAFIPPRAFVTGGIVINVSAPYWNHDASHIRNSLIHEIWHVGYSHLRPRREEAPLDDGQLYSMLEQLQNEGTATYVGYRARDSFPAAGEEDYRMLESETQRQEKLEAVQGLFHRATSVSAKKLQRLSWEIGVERRAYYIAGAHMAATIDRELGREELIRTLRAGPRSFIAAYNTLVPAEERLTFHEVPDRPPGSSRLPWWAWLIGLASGVAVAMLLLRLRRRASG